MRNNNFYLVLIVFLLIGLTIGYAVINTTLNINGRSTINKNTWDVHFDNVVVKEDSVEAVKIPTITDKTTVDFEVALNLPGDFYEFTVDVVNDGSIDAMIESVEKIPELSEAQQKYLNYTITYENDEPITTKQLVEKESFVRLKVKVELRKDIDPSDLPDVGDVLYLSFTINYQQADNSGVSVTDNGTLKVKPIANGDINEVGTIVTIGTEKFYTIGIDGDNVKLFTMYNLYVGNECATNSDSSCIPYGEEATGMQDENMRGYQVGKNIRKGTTAFSSDTKKGINYSSYEGSIVEEYVNNYKALLESNFGLSIEEARLVTKEELSHDKIGCSISNLSCSNALDFIYSISFWTGSSYASDTVWSIYNNGDFNGHIYSRTHAFGVRPVIIISKSLF